MATDCTSELMALGGVKAPDAPVCAQCSGKAVITSAGAGPSPLLV